MQLTGPADAELTDAHLERPSLLHRSRPFVVLAERHRRLGSVHQYFASVG